MAKRNPMPEGMPRQEDVETRRSNEATEARRAESEPSGVHVQHYEKETKGDLARRLDDAMDAFAVLESADDGTEAYAAQLAKKREEVMGLEKDLASLDSEAVTRRRESEAAEISEVRRTIQNTDVAGDDEEAAPETMRAVAPELPAESSDPKVSTRRRSLVARTLDNIKAALFPTDDKE